MDLLSNLNSKNWENKHDPPENPGSIGYAYYHVFRREGPHPDKTIKFYLQKEDGTPVHATIKYLASKQDPLKNVANVYLKVGQDSEVLGIILDGDWVERIY